MANLSLKSERLVMLLSVSVFYIELETFYREDFMPRLDTLVARTL